MPDRSRSTWRANPVEISSDERDELVERLRIISVGKTIVRMFEAVGASRPVELDDTQCGGLRMTLHLWHADVGEDLSEGIERLLVALTEPPPRPSALTPRAAAWPIHNFNGAYVI